jgi:hypothetical protein
MRQSVVNMLTEVVRAATDYVRNNPRNVLGLAGLLLAAWGGVVKAAHPTIGDLMMVTGVSLKAWLTDSTSKQKQGV